MGCLRKIVQIIILALAIVGFVTIGGKDFLIAQYNKYVGTAKTSVMERASKLGDFSGLSDEFEIDKAASAFGYKGVLAEHEASGQKMLIVDTGKKPMLTEDDFDENRAEAKIKELIKNFSYKSLQVDDFTIIKTGNMNAYGENVKYIGFTAKINKLPIGKVRGIISAIDLNSDKSLILLSLNEDKKYSQLIADEFFKKVKPAK